MFIKFIEADKTKSTFSFQIGRFERRFSDSPVLLLLAFFLGKVTLILGRSMLPLEIPTFSE